MQRNAYTLKQNSSFTLQVTTNNVLQNEQQFNQIIIFAVPRK